MYSTGTRSRPPTRATPPPPPSTPRTPTRPTPRSFPPPSFRARCRSAADHASCYVTLVAWLLLPFFFLGLYVYNPEAAVPPLAVPPPLPTQKGTTAALVSTRSCAELRGRTPGGWRTTTSNVCSEVQVAGKQCATAKVWIAARKLCEKAGGRLCTSAEVRAGALAQSSCDVGERAVWTSTRCGAGTNYLIELGSGRAGARVANTSKPSGGGIPNCERRATRSRWRAAPTSAPSAWQSRQVVDSSRRIRMLPHR